MQSWKALLTAFRDLALQSNQTFEENPPETAPISRTLDPVAGPVVFTEAAQDPNQLWSIQQGRDYSRLLGGFRFLTDDMIQTLSERIVDEVRLRGPFLSLADFVNRRLVPAGGSPSAAPASYQAWLQARTNGQPGGGGNNHNDFIDPTYEPFLGLHGLSGTLQRAIQVSGLNGGVNDPRLGEDGGQALGNNTPYAQDRAFGIRIRNGGGAATQQGNTFNQNGIGGQANTRSRHTQEPTMRLYLDTEHFAGAPAGEAGQLMEGAPGFVTQGDLLAMIGPALVPRGDTFLIRTYGDAVSPSGEVLSRVWLEAVVQRVVDPVQPAGSTGADRWRPTTEMGRRFEVVRMRWLNPEEV